ncbi:cyclin-dependent kinase-like 3 [Phlebotomus argentipes]|uniref:cyclin-dependent kinase-like 3 n=1 Tax=Phlebotomus argentipes TaxID=94469 RepID=UPI002892ECD2|nr:cyclin-dependent kinase-like 3 [Phlebotomus argentipes]XP_059608630.1 cyclin-dependent kinase-like 3 [Phlebotomus argentipes]
MEKYDVISVVGEGSYGLVMRCRHRESGQYVAIKKFLETEDDPTVRKMAMREIRMLKRLRHENLVNMIEVFRRKKRFFLVFEYLEHTVLEELEARSGGLGFVTARKYIYQVVRALDFIHSNDVIHRDIKPENVLVSRLGIVKLCDFGFARTYAENETFTDYVATRWYRSPELLVGDPRYGKEVDIWATGCLYAEMMTGEPLFPGESDVDQLFQIVRVLGKVNARHQVLITRNTIFKGMKQEQDTNLNSIFPEWNRDSLNFLEQCLQMDTMSRPDTRKLLKHDLFTKDDFLDQFLPELKVKLSQEAQLNPLLKRIQSVGNSGKKTIPIDEAKTQQSDRTTRENKMMPNATKERIGQIGLSFLTTSQILGTTPNKISVDVPPMKSDENNFASLNSYKNYFSNQHYKLLSQLKSNSINTNNLGKDVLGSKDRVLSAHKDKINMQNLDANIHPGSPVQFQSLQMENLQTDANLGKKERGTYGIVSHGDEKPANQTLPMDINSLAISGSIPQYFSNKRHSNLMSTFQCNQKTTTNPIMAKQSPIPIQLTVNRPNLVKRDRGILLDAVSNSLGIGQDPLKTDTSPRILLGPPWLTGKDSKITAQIGKKGGGLTDWKSISHSNKLQVSGSHILDYNSSTSNPGNDLVLPNCPGASTSPYKGTKKKLTPMTGIQIPGENTIFPTPRNFSPSSDQKNNT